ncbi:hypothetical protein KAI87_12665 [Myxococcota bacterium]|nr:hypothetical protein [Myxococcota bacterium]
MKNRFFIPSIFFVLFTLLFGAMPAEAREFNLAYVRASSQYQSKTDEGLYHPLNLIDDDAKTQWCEGDKGLGENESIRFVFKKPQKIDLIVVTPSMDTGRIVLEVEVSDGTHTFKFPLETLYESETSGQATEQPISPPLKGSVYTVSIHRVAGPNEGSELANDVACLNNIQLFYKGRAYGAKGKLKVRYDPKLEKILGLWNMAPLGAPEAGITFALDGTWSWKSNPFDGSRPRSRWGEYRFRGSQLLMREGASGRWSNMGFKSRTVKVNPEDDGSPSWDYQVIELGRLIKTVEGEYNNAVFE